MTETGIVYSLACVFVSLCVYVIVCVCRGKVNRIRKERREEKPTIESCSGTLCTTHTRRIPLPHQITINRTPPRTLAVPKYVRAMTIPPIRRIGLLVTPRRTPTISQICPQQDVQRRGQEPHHTVANDVDPIKL